MADTDNDADLQALLDLDVNGHNLQIIRRANASSTVAAFYVERRAHRDGNIGGGGKWVNCTVADTDADKAAAIKAAFGVA